MTRTNFERLEVYRLSEAVADAVWDLVIPWDRFAKDTVFEVLWISKYQMRFSLSAFATAPVRVCT